MAFREMLSAKNFVGHLEHQLSGDFRSTLISASLKLNKSASKMQTI